MHLNRVKKQLSDLQKNPPQNCSVQRVENDDYHWHAIIIGSDNTPYAGGIFKLDIVLPNDYPFRRPAVKFITKIYHPCIYGDGGYRLDILVQWSPARTVSKVLQQTIRLMDNPDPNTFFIDDIAKLYRYKRAEFEKNARQYTKKYAIQAQL